MRERVLISGATGFLGKSIVQKLISLDYDVIALIRQSSNVNPVKAISKEIIFANISESTLDQIFKRTKPDVVVHCAVSYGRSEDVIEVFNTNLKLFNELLHSSIQNDVKHFLNTDTFSGKSDDYSYLEAYHLSKRHALEWAIILLKTSKMKFSNLRLEHLYGPFDNHDKFIPFVISSLKRNEKVVDFTSGVQKRDFVYIDDVVEAYLAVINKQSVKFCEYEVGTGVSTSIKDFILLCKESIQGCKTKLNFGKLPTRKGEYGESTADIRNLESLGWKPKIQLDEGISKLVNSAEY